MQTKFIIEKNTIKCNAPMRVGAVCVIWKEQTILLEQRSDCDEWGFVGGGLEENESIEQCLVREVFEETGIYITNFELLFILSDPNRKAIYADGNISRIFTHVYQSHLLSNSVLIKSNESKELHFYDIDEIQNLNIVATHKDIVTYLLKTHNNFTL